MLDKPIGYHPLFNSRAVLSLFAHVSGNPGKETETGSLRTRAALTCLCLLPTIFIPSIGFRFPQATPPGRKG